MEVQQPSVMASQPDLPQSPSVKAKSFLSSLLGRQMRLYASDDRIFAGEFKCTDNECNIILSGAYEYRPPTQSAVAAATAAAPEPDKVRVDMTSRFMGLVVVPGKHVTKIEIDE